MRTIHGCRRSASDGAQSFQKKRRIHTANTRFAQQASIQTVRRPDRIAAAQQVGSQRRTRHPAPQLTAVAGDALAHEQYIAAGSPKKEPVRLRSGERGDHHPGPPRLDEDVFAGGTRTHDEAMLVSHVHESVPPLLAQAGNEEDEPVRRLERNWRAVLVDLEVGFRALKYRGHVKAFWVVAGARQATHAPCASLGPSCGKGAEPANISAQDNDPGPCAFGVA